MATNVLVPRLGEGVEEVTVTKWLKSVGDPIKELEALLEVNTDKVDTEIPSPTTGMLLQVLIEEGSVAKVGDVLAVIGQNGEGSEHPGTRTSIHGVEARSTNPSEVSLTPPSRQESPIAREVGFISPVVAKIAAEHGINLLDVAGSGLGGKITKNDVLAYVERREKINATENTTEWPATISATATKTESSYEPAANAQPGDRLVKHSLIRKSIAEHMLASKRSSPHVLTVMEVDLSRTAAHRAANKESFARDGANLTFTAYFMSAIVSGLKAHPMVNSSWSDEGVMLHSSINLGMATSLDEEGLIVPVIKNADTLSLLGMARSINDLAGRARSKKLQPHEVKGGTFTLTNHGVSGSLFAMPIINQPQCGILGIGAIQKRAVVITDENGNDSIAIRPMAYLSFVFDHRILDGASADWFLAHVKETLEKWKIEK